MNLRLFVYVFMLQGATLFAQPAFQWAKNFGGTASDGPGAAIVDAFSNVYTVGLFRGTADIDPGSGVFTVSAQGYTDIFIAKLTAAGNFVWGKSLVGIDQEEFTGFFSDAAGNFYLSGVFSGIVDFDPGPGTYTLAPTTFTLLQDNFILKLDSLGNFLWAISFGGQKADRISSMALDDSGYILTTGYFSDSTDFDPGPAVYKLAPTANAYDAYILKLDTSGNFIWVKTFTAQNQNMIVNPHNIATDNQGNVYTTGIYTATYDFDPGAGTFTMTSASNFEAYVSKLDASGNFVWAKKFSTTSPGSSNNTYGDIVRVDANKQVYCMGTFLAPTDFNPGVGTYTLPYVAGGGTYLTKLDSMGNFIWAKGVNASGPSGLQVTSTGSIYLGINSTGIPDFDPGPGTYTLASAGNYDAFMVQLDSTGAFSWAARIGGPSMDVAGSLIVDPFGSIYLAGNFSSSPVDFDPGTGSYTIATTGSFNQSDVFVAKLGDCFTPTTAVNYQPVICTGIGTTTYSVNVIPLAQNYNWSVPSAINVLVSQNSITLTLMPGVTSLNLSVTPVNSCGSGSTMVLAIPVNTIPFISAPDGTICFGQFFTITPSGAFSYTYSNGGPLVNPLSDGVYTISGSSTNGCLSDNQATLTVYVLPLPAIGITTSSLIICSGEQAALTATGGVVYEWSDGSQMPAITISPSMTMVYTVTGTDANGCSNEQTFTQLVDACTGVKENDGRAPFQVYPNPNNGEFVIDLKAGAILEIYNPLGQLMAHKKLEAGKNNLSYTDLAIGLYLMKIREANSVRSAYFIRN